MSEALDLDAYLARIRLAAPPPASRATLEKLHLAQALSIPFENLDIQLGKHVHLDLETLQRKLVGGGRGGYCFELNTLFWHALRALGFDPIPYGARVRSGASRVLPRTHMALVVPVDGAEVLADVGFGGTGPLEPVPMDGAPHAQHGFTYRVAAEGGLHVLQLAGPAGWEDLYAFDRAPCLPVDFEVANWFTSTHPQSRFVTTLTVQRSTLEARHVLRNLEHSVIRPSGTEVVPLAREALVPVIRATFGLDVPGDATFLALDGPAPPAR